ncbi:MAG: hypothetical protein ACLP1X_33075 [Polyangiaceae bacterium]
MRPANLCAFLLAGTLGCGLGLGGSEGEGGVGPTARGTTGGGPSGDVGDLGQDAAFAEDGDLGNLALGPLDPDGSGGPGPGPRGGDAGVSMDDGSSGSLADADAEASAFADANGSCGQLESCCKTLSALGSSSTSYQSCESEVASGDAGTCQSALLALAFVGVCL